MPGPLAFDFAGLDEGEGVAGRHQPDRLDDAIARVVAFHEGTRVRDDGERPATEHRWRGQSLVQHRGIGRGRCRVRTEVPPFQRRPDLGLELGREAGHESLREQLVVALGVEQRGDHRDGRSNVRPSAAAIGRWREGGAAPVVGKRLAIGSMVAEAGGRAGPARCGRRADLGHERLAWDVAQEGATRRDRS